MAKILISYFSEYGEAMYDAITDILHKNGNDIFRLNINNSLCHWTGWGGKSNITNSKLMNNIKEFKPDVIFSFNNSLPLNCYKLLPDYCKICVIDADAPEVAFWNKNVVYKYFDRFVFLGLQSSSKEMYESYLGKKLDFKNYLYFPPATIVKSENLKKHTNISFIGTNFYPNKIPSIKSFYSNNSYLLYDAFKKNYFLSYSEALKIYPQCSVNVFNLVKAYYCGQERLKYLQQLTDLGLVLYGTKYWKSIAYYDFDIAKCFNPAKITSIEENQNVYNSSKIAVNISHPLAQTSFSWRVMDIMASGACLLMEDKPDWRDLFEQFLSQETIDSIIYRDRFDMREKAIKLLNDENLRLRCVAELNNAIEKNGRWESRFKKLEDFLSIKLLNNEIKETQINIFVEREDILPRQKIFIRRLKLKKRYKIFIYSLLLIFAQIPLVDLWLNKDKREILKDNIIKYWR